MEKNEKTLKRREIFKGNIVHLVEDQVELANGQTATREIVFHAPAVAILPLLSLDKALFIRQFRKALEEVIWEIPAGLVEEDEDLLLAAQRELEEETGYQGKTWDSVTPIYTSAGFCDEVLHPFTASHLEKVENPLDPDADEDIDLIPLTFTEAWDLYQGGQIKDAKTIIGLYHWKDLREGVSDDRRS